MLKSILGAGVAASLLLAGAAEAAVVMPSDQGGGDSGGPTALSYFAEGAERNDAVFTRTATSITVTDAGAIIRPSPGNEDNCEISEGGHRATCTDPDGFTQLTAELREGDDAARSEIVVPVGESFSTDLGGGPGNDTLTGSDAASDDLNGGSGDDTLLGRGGNDDLSDFDFDFANSGISSFTFGGTNTMSGGDGADYFLDGPGDDTLRGEGGNDQIVANSGGTDQATGGDGQDFLDRSGFAGDTTEEAASFDGGPGEDGVRYLLFNNFRTGERVTPDSPGATVRLDAGGPTTGNGLPGQRDTLTSVENAFGSFGRDSFTGSAGSNRLSTSNGNDSVVGGAGLDVLDAGPDRDSVDARDGGPDRVRCGDAGQGDPGDTAQVDEADDVERGPAPGAGTTVTPTPRPAPPAPPAPQVVTVPPPAPDVTDPGVRGTRIPKTIKLADLRRRGLRVVLGSQDPGRVLGVATMTGKLKGRARVAAIGDLIIAQKTQGFTRQATVTLKPTAKLGRSIRRGSRLRVVVEVRDLAGNLSLVTQRVRIR